MKQSGWLVLTLILGVYVGVTAPPQAQASISTTSKNGVVRTGGAILAIMDHLNSDSLLVRCNRENAGTRIFANSCKEFIEQLQKKMSLMSLETDIQIQSERINSKAKTAAHQQRIAMLAKLNLIATQAEDAIKTLKANYSENHFQEHLLEILPTVTKVQTSYTAYLKLLPDAQATNP